MGWLVEQQQGQARSFGGALPFLIYITHTNTTMYYSEHLHALARQWREEAQLLRDRFADDRAAKIVEVRAEDLEDALRTTEEALLNLQQASQISGYSAEHLGRLVREGTIPNHGRPNAPRVRLKDLPRKTSGLPTAPVRLQLEGAGTQTARSIVNSIN